MLLKYQVKLIKKEMIAENSLLFIVERPADFEFIPGQFVEMTLVGLEDLKPAHFFSIVSPEQNKNEIHFLARIRDSVFKNQLMGMQPGEMLNISEARGPWTIDKATKTNIMFIVGGVGIASVMSIVDSINLDPAQKEKYKIGLLSSNHSVVATPFLDVLENEWHDNKCQTYFIFTREDVKRARSYNRHLDTEMVNEVRKGVFGDLSINEICFYICGSVEFVVEIRKLLLSMGVTVNDIKVDLFTGY